MKKMLLISMLVLIIFVVGCSEQSKKELVNDLKDKVENIEKEKYDERVAETDAETEDTSSKTTEVNEEATKEVEEETKNVVDEKTDEKTDSDNLAADDTTDDCSLLSVDDIKEVCGAMTVAEDQVANVDQGQVCIKMFKTDDPMKSMKVYYTGDNSKGSLSAETLAESSCNGMKAEMITDYSCYAEIAGKSVYVFGKKRTVIINNALPMEDYFLCSREQLKELGKIVSDRIYK